MTGSYWCGHCQDNFDREHYGEDGYHLAGAEYGPTGASAARAEMATEALALIASRSCETTSALGPGACTRSDRFAYSDYGIHRWCDACVAWAALNGVPLTRHPSGWCEACGAVVAERQEVSN